MNRRTARIVPRLLLGVLTAGLLAAGPATPAPAVERPVPTAVPTAAADAVTDVRQPEVRLRKLYLVRPDLLHYPVPYDVVC